jgi:ZIP family zinc transporter
VTDTYVAVLGLSLLSVVTTVLGVALAIVVRRSDVGIAVGIGFSAGIMLLISFAELLPEAIAGAGAAPALGMAALGAGLIAALHVVIPHTHLFKESGAVALPILRSAHLVALGLILHDLPEGFAMANAYVAAPSLGVLVAVGIALHNLPEEFIIALPALAVRDKRLLFVAAALSALAEPVGAAIGLVAVGALPALNALFMAFAAGAMIFVSLHELVPLARRYRRLSAFVAGMVISVVTFAALEWFVP